MWSFSSAIIAFVLILTYGPTHGSANIHPSACASSDCCILWLSGLQTETPKSGEPVSKPRIPAGPQLSVAPALIESLLVWIGEHSRYDVSPALSNPPTVGFCRPGMTVEYEQEDLVVERPLVAFYDIKKRHIFLVEPWNPDEIASVSSLLHELTHDVQHLSKDWPCWGKAEWEAYKLQERWLLEQGVTPDFNWADIFLQSLCPRDIHP